MNNLFSLKESNVEHKLATLMPAHKKYFSILLKEPNSPTLHCAPLTLFLSGNLERLFSNMGIYRSVVFALERKFRTILSMK